MNSSTQNNHYIKALKKEKLRQKYAEQSNYEKILKYYENDRMDLENNNSGSLWDKLNKETNYTKLNNPMAWDRLNLVTKWIKQRKFIVKVLNIGFGPANLEKLILNQSNNYIWFGIDISNKSVINANKLFRNASFKRQEIKNIIFIFHDIKRAREYIYISILIKIIRRWCWKIGRASCRERV
jgi:SAM-dependent methyltransferase